MMDAVRAAVQEALQAAARVEAAQWPGLEFNPAKGDLAAVDGLSDKVNRTAQNLRVTFEALDDIRRDRDLWRGEAARNFADKLEELPKFLDNAQQSMGKAGKALATWRDQLAAHQERATELESQARWWREQREWLDDSVRHAQNHPALALEGRTFPTPEEARAAQTQFNQAWDHLNEAKEAATKAWQSLNEVLDEAYRLRDEHADDERAAADAVRRADDGLAPPDPGMFSDILGAIGEIAGVAAAVLTVAACVACPALGPLAILAGGIAFGANATNMVVKGKFDPVQLGSDALGMIPGVGAVKSGVSAVKTASQSMRTVQGLRTATARTTQVLTDPSVLAGKFGRTFGGRLGPEGQRDLGQLADSSVNLGLQVPTVTGWVKGKHDPTVQDMQAVGSLGGLANSTYGAYGSRDTLTKTIGQLSRATG